MRLASGTLALALTASLAACGGGGGGSAGPVGVWDGTFTNVSAETGPMQVAALADGTLDVRVNSGSGWEVAVGAYSASGGTLSGTFVPDSGSTTFAYEATVSGDHLTGTIGFSPSTTGLASFSLTRAGAGGEGIYLGAYGNGAEDPSQAYLLILFPGGDIEAHDGGTLADVRALGTWSRSGADFSADYTYDDGGDSFSLLGTFSGATLSGTWGSPGDGTDGGLFTAAREQ